jgi:nitrite reductase/ring-hydroxylating ferredoxin subunit
MADDERRLQDAAERFDRYLDSLLGDGRPSPDVVDDRDEAEMARVAAEMAAAVAPDHGDPDPAFVEQVRRRMRAADEGLAAVRTPPPVRERAAPAGHARWQLSRRDLLRAGLGVAAGLAAGAAGIALSRPTRSPSVEPPTADGTPMVAGEGFWSPVALMSDLAEGSAMRFSTEAFDGYVVNDAGRIRALSSTCTHMGCTLQFRAEQRDLRCPCHGASFDLEGRLANGRRGWREQPYPGDSAAYPIDLPDLARPRVKSEDGWIWVWTAQI